MLPTYKITPDSKLNTILTTKFAAAKNGHVEVGQDKVILPQEFEKHQEEILNFEVRDDDVYVLGFPRTGTRRVDEMVWLLMNNLDFEKAREVDLIERFPLFELEVLHDDFENYLQKINALKSPRFIESHLPWSLLPKSLKDGSKQPKMIVVLRGAEDTCISYHYVSQTVNGYNGSFEEFCELFLGGKVRFGPYWNHVLGYWNQRDRSNIMFLKVNEMNEDMAGSIRKVAEFLGKGLSDEEVAAMCDHLTMANLKTSKGFILENLFKTRGRDKNPFVKPGIVGTHKEILTAENIAAFKAQRELYLNGTGLTLD